jgi:hypothetical protein
MKRSTAIILTIYLIGCFFQWGYFVNRPDILLSEREQQDEFSANVAPVASCIYWPIYWPAQLVKHITKP